MLGPDNLGERAGTLESDQPGFESLLICFLAMQPGAKEVPPSFWGSVFSSAEWVTEHQRRAVRVKGQTCAKSFFVSCEGGCCYSQGGVPRADRESRQAACVRKVLKLGAQMPFAPQN